jgi:hypothetical protein
MISWFSVKRSLFLFSFFLKKKRAALNTTIQNRRKKRTIRRIINTPKIIFDIIPPLCGYLKKINMATIE